MYTLKRIKCVRVFSGCVFLFFRAHAQVIEFEARHAGKVAQLLEKVGFALVIVFRGFFFVCLF